MRRDGGWVVRNSAKGVDLAGCERPGRALRFKLTDPHGRSVNLTVAGWMMRAGLLDEPPEPAERLPIPGFARYQLARRPDSGRWAVRTTVGSVRWRGRWLVDDRQLSLVGDDGTPVVRQFTHLVLEAHGRLRPSEQHVAIVDPGVDPGDWPDGLTWRLPATCGTPAVG